MAILESKLIASDLSISPVSVEYHGDSTREGYVGFWRNYSLSRVPGFVLRITFKVEAPTR